MPGPEQPGLKPLHSDDSLSPTKLAKLSQFTTEFLLQSLLPGQAHSLKTRPDGTMLDGHHRIRILRTRGLDVDTLPRDIVERAESS
jgi:hypothetical protein